MRTLKLLALTCLAALAAWAQRAPLDFDPVDGVKVAMQKGAVVVTVPEGVHLKKAFMEVKLASKPGALTVGKLPATQGVDEVGDDGKGGWTDQGPKLDLREFPTGKQIFGGVLFQIGAEPHGCIVLKSDKRPHPELQPEEQATVVGRIAEFFHAPHLRRRETPAGVHAGHEAAAPPHFLRASRAVGRADDVRC